MPSSTEPRLSAGTREALDGSHLDDAGRAAMVLASTAASGAPHVALLSRGEVLAVGDDTLRIALHAHSGTAANLTQSGRATLLLAGADGVETIGLQARALGHADVAGQTLALFEARVTESRDHAVPYATVTSGIAFELADPAATLARWEATLDLLRRADVAT